MIRSELIHCQIYSGQAFLIFVSPTRTERASGSSGLRLSGYVNCALRRSPTVGLWVAPGSPPGVLRSVVKLQAGPEYPIFALATYCLMAWVSLDAEQTRAS